MSRFAQGLAALRRRSARPRLSLALQGGGAHGAFTWGVVDRLLDSFSISAVTGTSAGAVNAVCLASGLARGGPDEARRTLEAVWTAVADTAGVRWLVHGPDDNPSLTPLARAAMQLTRTMSPSQLNPLDHDPLRDVLARHVDFEVLRGQQAPMVTLAATNARTGRLRLFSNDELSVETVLASACLPSVHKAVEIDGQPYWDGGFSANPPLLPLLDGPADDALAVLICPIDHRSTPRRAVEIRDRQAEFAFTTAFLRESELLAAATARARASSPLRRGDLERRLARMRWHLLDADHALASVSSQTRMIPHRPFLESLRLKGVAAADLWIQTHANQVGRASTADLAALGPA
ncbi:MAG: patatin-like phospholipase family protein [Actinomycetales bacterium]